MIFIEKTPVSAVTLTDSLSCFDFFGTILSGMIIFRFLPQLTGPCHTAHFQSTGIQVTRLHPDQVPPRRSKTVPVR
jgi:hypothetical protein